ncbi:MAG: ATP-binding cassette domain-containing protein, partial [Thermogladius sp.]
MLLEAKIDEAGYAGGFKIRGVSLELDEGELVVVTGKSGSGKTTLARALTNTITLRGGYLRGDVRLLGKSVKEYQPGELAGVLAYIPQEPWYGIIGYTVMSEFCYTQLIVRDKCDLKALNEAGLGGMEDFITYGLSAGQTQLLLWAEALATGARVIVMDEPLVYLDEAGRSKMKSLVRKQLSEGKGFVVVDHDPLFWAELRPRFILISDGVVEYDGYTLSWAWE